MNIGVVGAGKIGGTVGVLWAKAGHSIPALLHPRERKMPRQDQRDDTTR